MDLLSKRYANPCFFLEGMIQSGRFAEFVDNFVLSTNKEIELENKEKEMQLHWDFWLHKIYGKSFKEYIAEIESTEDHKNISEGTLETTFQHSMDILNNFNPEKGGE